MYNVSFCAINVHKQITKAAKDKFNKSAIQEVAFPSKGHHKDSGLVDILEFTDEHLTEWLNKSKNMQGHAKADLAMRLYKAFKS